MPNWKPFLLLCSIAIFNAGSFHVPARNRSDAEIRLIRAVFHGYLKMLRERNGRGAATLVDQTTLAYYARMHHLALHGTERQVRALPIMDRIIVLRTRHQIPLAELQKMNRAKYFAHGVKMDWMDSARASTLSPGIIEVHGKRATVFVMQNGRPTPLTFAASKEGPSTWRIDLTSFFAAGSAAFKAMVPKGEDENEFILDLLKTISGRAPSPAVWRPLIP